MSCPDEDTFARVQAGLLSPGELTNFHIHLDNCPACLELAGVLGCLGDNERAQNGVSIEQHNVTKSTSPQVEYGVTPTATATTAQVHSEMSLIAFCAIILTHAYFTYSISPVFWRASEIDFIHALPPGKLGVFGPIVITYLELWGIVGIAWAGVGLWALLAGWRWARMAVRSYAILSVPTIVLAPLSFCVLFALRQPQNYPRISQGRNA